jgi:hypothetical protein
MYIYVCKSIQLVLYTCLYLLQGDVLAVGDAGRQVEVYERGNHVQVNNYSYVCTYILYVYIYIYIYILDADRQVEVYERGNITICVGHYLYIFIYLLLHIYLYIHLNINIYRYLECQNQRKMGIPYK